MTWVREYWDDFWFGADSAENLGFCRLLFLGILLCVYVPLDMSAWGSVSQAFWMPIALFRALPLPLLDVDSLNVLQWIWKLALLCGAVGFHTRVSCTIATVISLYLLGLPHNFGKTHHFDTVIVMTLGILALSRSGDAWSIDALRKGRVTQPSGRYRWPVRTVWLMLSMVFFSAGAQKLRHGKLEWIFSDNLSVMLLQHAYQVSNDDPLTTWGLWVAQFPALCIALALMTVFVEFCYPLALVSKRARWFFPAAMCASLIGIRVFMGPTFGLFIICHLFWVPWDRVLPWLQGGVARRSLGAELAS